MECAGVLNLRRRSDAAVAILGTDSPPESSSRGHLTKRLLLVAAARAYCKDATETLCDRFEKPDSEQPCSHYHACSHRLHPL